MSAVPRYFSTMDTQPAVGGTTREMILFQCTGCGDCCRWPGLVRLSEDDVRKAATHLGISEKAFTDTYTTLSPDRQCLVLKDREDGACVFLKGDDCSIHHGRPQQCRGFPNAWDVPELEDKCPALRLKIRIRTLSKGVSPTF